MPYELSPYMRRIDVVAGNPINEWFKLMGRGMKWDLIGLHESADIHGDPAKLARAIKLRDKAVAAMEQLEAESPALRKMVKTLIKKPNPGWKLLEKLQKKMDKQIAAAKKES